MPDVLDLFFPANGPLRKAAQGDSDAPAVKAAQARAAANPSGIDMAAEAQKAAVRNKVPSATQGASSTPVTSGTAKRDHYAPKSSQK